MLDKKSLFKEFSIDEEYFKSTGLVWEELVKIYDDYTGLVPELEKLADSFTFQLIDTKAVHSVRRRVKKPAHLIEKIIRKGKKYVDRNISVENYKEIVTDLIGVRILHLFKDDWIDIHSEILKCWSVAEIPQINVRPGDYNMDILEKHMTKLNCEVIVREHGYRSVHYLIETKTESGEKLYVEMQVRTVFEEAWSEIDHIIRYPYDVDNSILSDYLSIFNRIVGSADEMGTFIKNLKPVVSDIKEYSKDRELDIKFK